MLADPFPSNPCKPTRFSLTACRRDPTEECSRTYIVGYTEAYAAKHWLLAMLEYDQPDTITSPQLDQLMAYSFTAEEAKWQLPRNERILVARFYRGIWDVMPVQTATHEITATVIPVKVKRDEVPPGFISISDLVKGTSLIPMKARSILRSNNLEKPSYGWAFAPDKVADIRKLLGV